MLLPHLSGVRTKRLTSDELSGKASGRQGDPGLLYVFSYTYSLDYTQKTVKNHSFTTIKTECHFSDKTSAASTITSLAGRKMVPRVGLEPTTHGL